MVKLFKFLKTKKGFSLVELMIVVVIMAILVAVAVPIFNSVTSNAREKTCVDNQRQILGAATNLIAMHNVSGVAGKIAKIYFKRDANGEAVVEEDPEFTVAVMTNNHTTFAYFNIQSAFQLIPVCAEEGEVLTLTMEGNPGALAISKVSCSNANHVLMD